MFQNPEAKRVRREDLFKSASSDESESEDEDAQAALRAQLSGLFDLTFKSADSQPACVTNDDREEDQQQQQLDEETFTFRLFRDEEPAQTSAILTRDEDLAQGDLGVIKRRDISYYIASPPSPLLAARYRSSAVTAEYLRADAKAGRRWGLEKPWRVVHISNSAYSSAPATGKTSGDHNRKEDGTEKKKRTRPGKKHRILQRQKEKAKHEREELAKQKAVEKETHIQEKKKRLNRERKLKRRAKEREKKKEALSAGSADMVGQDDDGESHRASSVGD
ncbi:hypothetical protein F5Y16DRAFT_47379 [Xylariaceae sp. FL0255]|nr:hypothetical protein F5Y16DRAFT_47379 [Xylariaceae sp. FL0255]